MGVSLAFDLLDGFLIWVVLLLVGLGRFWSALFGFGRLWSALVGFGRLFGRLWSAFVGVGCEGGHLLPLIHDF